MNDSEIALQRVEEWIQNGDVEKTLILRNLKINSLPPLPASLQVIDCSNTPITSLPPLPDSLKILACNYTKITSLPPLPKSLQCLFCSDTPITSLPPLPDSLNSLTCFHTKITSLPSLSDSLKLIYCFNTPITSLPPFPASLDSLMCYNCPNLLIQRKENESIQAYEARWKVFREKIVRDRCVQRCKAVKGDLMAKTWHPKRFETWCLDVQEQEFNSKERTIHEWMEFDM